MKEIMRGLGLLGLALALSGVAQANQLSWYVTAGAWSNHNDSALLYSSNPQSSNNSYLVQLVYAGLNGVADAATEGNSTGVTVDDVVVAYSWIGFGVPNTLRSGHVQMSGVNAYNNPYTTNSMFFIRAWEAPESAAGGSIPQGQSYYGDSFLYAITSLVNPENFEAGTAQPTWHAMAIPEASTGACVFALLMGMAGYRRLRRWRE